MLELSLREAIQLGHNYIGTEHILLGLIREGEGVAAQVLVKLGAELTRVRARVTEVLAGTASTPEPGPEPASTSAGEFASLVAENHRLREEIDRLRAEVERLSEALRRFQSPPEPAG